MQVQWQAWAQELNVLGLAITEMVSKIHTVGTNYSTADSANVRNTALAAGDKADLVFSRWLGMVATLLAVRQPSRSAAQGVHPNDA